MWTNFKREGYTFWMVSCIFIESMLFTINWYFILGIQFNSINSLAIHYQLWNFLCFLFQRKEWDIFFEFTDNFCYNIKPFISLLLSQCEAVGFLWFTTAALLKFWNSEKSSISRTKCIVKILYTLFFAQVTRWRCLFVSSCSKMILTPLTFAFRFRFKAGLTNNGTSFVVLWLCRNSYFSIPQLKTMFFFVVFFYCSVILEQTVDLSRVYHTFWQMRQHQRILTCWTG